MRLKQKHNYKNPTTMAIGIKKVETLEDIKEGDLLLVRLQGFAEPQAVKAEQVKTSADGVEVIYNKRKNFYFNVGMYLLGKSSVKEVVIVTTP
jgi:hypothetical protein